MPMQVGSCTVDVVVVVLVLALALVVVVVVEPSWKNFLDKSGTCGSNLQALVEDLRNISTGNECK